MKKLFYISIFIALLFSSCKKDPVPVDTGVTDAMARDSLYYLILLKAYQLLPAQVAQPLNMIWPVILVFLSVPILKQKRELPVASRTPVISACPRLKRFPCEEII